MTVLVAAVMAAATSAPRIAYGAPTPVNAVVLTDAALADSSNAWAVGLERLPNPPTPQDPYSPVLLHTANAGATWTSVSYPSVGELVAITFADAQHGWAFASGGGIIATTDGGATWAQQPSPTDTNGNPVNLGPQSASFVDPAHGWDASHGYTAGVGGLVVTSNGGATWQAEPLPTVAAGYTFAPTQVRFVDTSHGWLAGDLCPTGPLSHGMPPPCNGGAIAATTDGGHTWTIQATLFRAHLSMLNATVGYAAGLPDSAAPPVLFVTSDGGRDWVREGTLPWRNAEITFADVAHGWADGTATSSATQPTIWSTADGGAHWSPEPVPVDPDATGVLNAIRFLSGTSIGVAVGYGDPLPARLVMTKDGGATWQSYPHLLLVRQLFLDLLARPADAGGLAYWMGQVDGGLPRPTVVDRLDGTAEYRALQLAAMYRLFLHRAPDPGGLQYFMDQIAAGATYERAASVMIGLSEYYGSRAGGTDGGWVSAVYADVLNRPVDGGAQSYWTQQLSAGVPRETVAYRIVTSAEAYQDATTSWYAHMLHHTPDPNGLAYWVDLMQRGMRDEAVVAGIAGSDEYYEAAVTY